MINRIQSDTGDLGLSTFTTEIHEFPLTVKIASRILYDARKFIHMHTDEILSYPIRLPIINQLTFNTIIERLEKELPIGIYFYDVDGRKLFELRGPSGGITTNMMCYLIARFQE